MNVVPLARRTQMMNQRIDSAEYVKVLSESMNFPLSVNPSKRISIGELPDLD